MEDGRVSFFFFCSGFTKLTQKLTAEGATGLAAMSKYLNK
jgi:hypothetical protein